MSITMKSEQQNVTRSLEVIAVISFLCDAIVGVISSLAFDLSEPWALVNALAFTLAPVLYLIRWRSIGLANICLIGLFVLRWFVFCFDSKPPQFSNPIVWPTSVFLFVGLVCWELSLAFRANAVSATAAQSGI